MIKKRVTAAATVAFAQTKASPSPARWINQTPHSPLVSRWVYSMSFSVDGAEDDLAVAQRPVRTQPAPLWVIRTHAPNKMTPTGRP